PGRGKLAGHNRRRGIGGACEGKRCTKSNMAKMAGWKRLRKDELRQRVRRGPSGGDARFAHVRGERCPCSRRWGGVAFANSPMQLANRGLIRKSFAINRLWHGMSPHLPTRRGVGQARQRRRDAE